MKASPENSHPRHLEVFASLPVGRLDAASDFGKAPDPDHHLDLCPDCTKRVQVEIGKLIAEPFRKQAP